MSVHPLVASVTARIADRSAVPRRRYLDRVRYTGTLSERARTNLGCGNLAHGFAACGPIDKIALRGESTPNIAIVSSYNDLLSAHQPFADYPHRLRTAVTAEGGVAQFAGGVPAMCDGITQGRAGMELSLFSRDVIAMSTAVALAHDMFDGALLLGVCDKIVPGLLIGALSFGHLPVLFVPAGPMPSGLPNSEKARVREKYAAGEVPREQLLDAEAASYHAPGTCTFYGTANSNQVLMEVMGIHLPGASFVAPGTALRTALTAAAAQRLTRIAASTDRRASIAEIVNEKAIVNAVVALLATGGSTNHTIHLCAIAAAAGIELRWEDFADLSAVVPTVARIYPNGTADINAFHAAGGTAVLIGSLIEHGLLHSDVSTVFGHGLDSYSRTPVLRDGELNWVPRESTSIDTAVLRPPHDPFDREGGLRVLTGGLGQAVAKVSAVAPAHRRVVAPAAVFDSQEDFLHAFRRGELDRDIVVVLRCQGPRANGMPELHQLTPALGILQNKGFAVALVTDGRMSGASGKVPTAVHLTPEAHAGGPIGLLVDGDLITVDTDGGRLDIAGGAEILASRRAPDFDGTAHGTGRELFTVFRDTVSAADRGASVFRGLT